jgi:Cupin superfamily protein
MPAGDSGLSFEGAPALVAFLEEMGAARIKHSARTFLDHLVGVARLLEKWGASPDACKAGLFHSIYGTEYFKGAVLTYEARPRITALLGEAAERLAYVFCAFDRSSLYRALVRGAPYAVELRGGGTFDVTKDELADLARIVWANALEQAPHTRVTADDKARSRRAIEICAAFLSDSARRDLAEFYGAPSPSPGAAVMSSSSPSPTRAPGLAALFNVDDAKALLAKHWPNEYLVAKGPVERLAGLVDYDLDALIKMKKHHTQAFFKNLDGVSSSITVAPGQEKNLYDAGFTLYFHNIYAPRIATWVDAIDAELGLVQGVTRVSAFASRRGSGLKAHYDMNDNFVCQARGVKRWRVAPNTHVKNPTAGYTVGAKMLPVHHVEAPGGMPAELPKPFEVLELHPGTVAFMPRGMWHDTETLEHESLHFNIQSGLAMWKDAIEYILTKTSLLHAEELREPIMQMFDGDKLREGVGEEIKERIRAAVELLFESDIEIHRPSFHKYVMSRRPKNN